jgi:hypothetical protein
VGLPRVYRDPGKHAELERRRTQHRNEFQRLSRLALAADSGGYARETVDQRLDDFYSAAMALMNWECEVIDRFKAGDVDDPTFGSNAGRVHSELERHLDEAAQMVRRIGVAASGLKEGDRCEQEPPERSSLMTIEELAAVVTHARGIPSPQRPSKNITSSAPRLSTRRAAEDGRNGGIMRRRDHGWSKNSA